MAHMSSMWPAIETAKAINPEDSGVYCKLFNTGEWASLNKTGFFKVKYHNPENLILQHMAIKEDVYNDTENKYKNVNRFRNGDITRRLTSVDIEEVVRVGSVIKEFYEGFICENLDYNPFREYVLDMTAKRNEYKKQSKTILADLCKKISNGTYGGCIRCDIHDVLRCVSETWMKTEYDDRVKEYIPLKNGNYLVNIKDHDGVDDNGNSKKVNSQPFQFGSLILSHSKRLMNDVILALDGFRNNRIYYGDTDSIYIHKNDYNMLIEKGLVGKDLFQCKNDYGENAGIVYGLFLAPKVKYFIIIDENGVFNRKTTFKGYNQNIKNITFKDFLNLEQGKTLRNISKLEWKRELGGIKIPHRRLGCENCDESRKCLNCELKPEMNCFNCEIKKLSRLFK